MNKLWMRIFICGACTLLLLFFSNDFGLIDIQETAIVIAIAIDKGEEEGKFDVSAQIAVPAGTGTGTAGNVTVTGASTVGEAITELNHKTGWYPTLVHCKLVLLGEETTRENVFEILDYFLRSELVEDTCLVGVCEGLAKDAFKATSPVKDISSSAISKVLSSEAQKTGLISVTNLKDFAKNYYSVSGGGFLPFIAVKQEAESQGDDQAQKPVFNGKINSEISPVSSEGAKSGEKKSDVFDASRTMLFQNGKGVALLTPDETLAFNMADTPTDYAFGNIEVDEEDGKVVYDLKMKITKKSAQLSFENGKPVFTFRIRARAKIIDANKSDSILTITQSALVPEQVLNAAEEKFKKELSSAFEKSAAAGCDLFGVKLQLYRFHHKKYNAYKDTILNRVETRYDIRFSALK